jgi:NAD(P)-dependent dehydrogenase (short-subunit alcohol dehydrogenase family)/acyl carrier protein
LGEHPEQDATSRRIRAVRALEALGAEVLVVSADVSQRDAMHAVLAQVQERFGDLHGVIHSAGVPAGGLMQLKTREAAATILAPKVEGTLVLAELLRQRSLDFFVLCSSLTGLLGGVGQVDYTAANAFLDEFACAERARGGLPAIAIGWDGWREAGMAVDTQVPPELREQREQDLKLGLSNADGVAAFRRILAAGLPQVAVSTRDLTARVRRAAPPRETAPARPAGEPATDAGAKAAAPALHARPGLSTEYAAPRNDVERRVAAICGELLGVSPLGIHDNFFELGAHSLMALRMAARLNESFHVELPIARFFESPTVAQLAQQIEVLRVPAAPDDAQLAQLAQMVEQMSDEEVRMLLAQEGVES